MYRQLHIVEECLVPEFIILPKKYVTYLISLKQQDPEKLCQIGCNPKMQRRKLSFLSALIVYEKAIEQVQHRKLIQIIRITDIDKKD